MIFQMTFNNFIITYHIYNIKFASLEIDIKFIWQFEERMKM